MSDVIDEATKKRVLEEFLFKMNSEESQNLKTTNDDLTTLEQKLESFLSFNSPTPNFQRGDKVKWKTGLKNRKFPKDEQICMVVDVLSEPKTGERDSGSPYFGEPLDLILALLDEKKDLLIFHYDSRRFEIVEKSRKDYGFTSKEEKLKADSQETNSE